MLSGANGKKPQIDEAFVENFHVIEDLPIDNAVNPEANHIDYLVYEGNISEKVLVDEPVPEEITEGTVTREYIAEELSTVKSISKEHIKEEHITREPITDEVITDGPFIRYYRKRIFPQNGEIVTEERFLAEPEEKVDEPLIREQQIIEEPFTEKHIVDEHVMIEDFVDMRRYKYNRIVEDVPVSPVGEEIMTEQLITEEPIAEKPIKEEPITEEPISDARVTEELIFMESPVNKPISREYTAMESKKEIEKNSVPYRTYPIYMRKQDDAETPIPTTMKCVDPILKMKKKSSNKSKKATKKSRKASKNSRKRTTCRPCIIKKYN